MGNINSNLTGLISVRIIILEHDIHVRLSGNGILNGLSRNFYARRVSLLGPNQHIISVPTVEDYSFSTTISVEAEEVESNSDYESMSSNSSTE